MTLRSNPRLLVVYVILAVLVCAGAAAPFVIGVFFGLVVLAVALLFAWSLARLIRRQLATRVETLTDEVLFTLHGDEKIRFTWDQIRLAGLALPADRVNRADKARRGERRLFVYNEADDKMLQITDEFENLDGLAAELRERTDFRELALEPGETLKDRLRELVGHT